MSTAAAVAAVMVAMVVAKSLPMAGVTWKVAVVMMTLMT